MDDQVEPTSPEPTHRHYRLTPLPSSSEQDESTGVGGSRRKFIIGGLAVPFALTVRGRPAFAWGHHRNSCCVSHMIWSHRGSAPDGGDQGWNGPCGMPPKGGEPNCWKTQYPLFCDAYNRGWKSYRQLFPCQVTSNCYLGYPRCTTTFPCKIPGPTNGVTCTLSGSTRLSDCINGSTKLTVKVSFNNKSASRDDSGKFFQQAIPAILNASLYGPSAFGYSDSQMITYVNSVFTSMLSQAQTLRSKGKSPQQVLDAIFGSDGPIVNSQHVTSALSILNNQGNA
jgi:hypothetical protein